MEYDNIKGNLFQDFFEKLKEVSKMMTKKIENVFTKDEFKDFEDTLAVPDKSIEVYEWLLLSTYAVQGLAEAVRAVNDAYRLGFMTGKGAR